MVPHTPATEGMIGQRELDLIPDGRVFVNVSRGKVVDSEAMVARLKRGGLIAGLDVFDPEPFGDHPQPPRHGPDPMIRDIRKRA